MIYMVNIDVDIIINVMLIQKVAHLNISLHHVEIGERLATKALLGFQHPV